MASMTDDHGTESDAREIVAGTRYMVLATADAHGRPWATPVWYAKEDGTRFLWVSSPDARHSRNIAARPEIAVVIFDSQVTVGDASALYVAAVAREVADAEIGESIALFARVSAAQGLSVWGRQNVVAPAKHRLYEAVATERSLLGPGDERLPLVR
jgi:nitroimidazol reductase NimA-like FMN-containing flavoprotein (pyridoxamine 5'-phosphate oxidase superfamily)